ncbi:ankyrin repeat domain-containing protein 39 [Chelonus insularis]|uniref:ankyrin repeat domain-containing protein 39 n=1 Tax=Chelonus insularis TaxID=460826 RepID=UPI00158CA4D9|nr:ankyrin repeat domain-containing protein 39 [Chelonus insularis]
MAEDHHHHDHVCESDSGVRQTISEMDFDRGIWYAAQVNDCERLKYLLSKGISASATDSAGYTALHYAARSGHLAICSLLLEHGADVNAVTKSGRATPLHRAAMMGNIEMVEFLLKHKANCNIQDSDGYTPLHRAVLSNFPAVWDILKFKTDINIRDKHGKTAQELAGSNKNNFLLD